MGAAEQGLRLLIIGRGNVVNDDGPLACVVRDKSYVFHLFRYVLRRGASTRRMNSYRFAINSKMKIHLRRKEPERDATRALCLCTHGTISGRRRDVSACVHSHRDDDDVNPHTAPADRVAALSFKTKPLTLI